MKWWHWLILELLIIFGVITWIYFFPSDFEDDFAKGVVGLGMLWLVEECKEINRRNRMSENYTVEQNAGENRIEGGVVGISGSVEKQYRPFKDCNELIEHYQKKNESAVGCGIYFPSLYKPCIWVKSIEYGTDNLITAFDGDNESIGGSCVFVQDIWLDMQELFDNFTFLDGSPCGILE